MLDHPQSFPAVFHQLRNQSVSFCYRYLFYFCDIIRDLINCFIGSAALHDRVCEKSGYRTGDHTAITSAGWKDESIPHLGGTFGGRFLFFEIALIID